MMSDEKKPMYEGIGCLLAAIGLAVIGAAMSAPWPKIFERLMR